MIVFNAEKKKGIGKGAARALRRSDRIPAIVYGGHDQTMVSIVAKDFIQEYSKGNIQSKLVELNFGDSKMMVVPRAVQTHPVTDFPEHVDFQQVDLSTPIKVSIHVKVINDDKCPGLKKGGVMNFACRMIPFLCLPNSIPSHIIVDAAALEIGQRVHIGDIQLQEGMRPVAKDNFVIISISGRAEEKEPASGEAGASDKK